MKKALGPMHQWNIALWTSLIGCVMLLLSTSCNTDEPDIRITGLTSPVYASHDDSGMLHLSCQTDADCMAGLGYFHAKDRFYQMDFARRLMRGQLATAYGSALLDLDVQMRHVISSPRGEPLEDVIWNNAGDEVRELLRAYATGVNAFLADAKAHDNQATLTLEYTYPILGVRHIPQWQPQDSVAVMLFMFFQLSNLGSQEYNYGEAMAALAPEVAEDLLSLRPIANSPALPATYPSSTSFPLNDYRRGPKAAFPPTLRDRMRSHRAVIRKGRQALQPVTDLLSPDPTSARGSNNWVVSREQTAGAFSLLANDPHLKLTNPAAFYMVEIDSKSRGEGSLHVAGASIAGLPFITSGRNQNIAWGVTNAMYDTADVYTETLVDHGNAVLYNGRHVPLVTREVPFVSDSGMTTRTLRWVPHHGPIISEDRDQGTATTLRWVPMTEGSQDLTAFLALNRASSVEDARRALVDSTSHAQNFVVADREGNIGWFPYSKIPRRPWASPELAPWMPLPGDGSAEWDGFLDISELPQSVNPSQGFIATANNDMTGALADGDPTNDSRPYLQGIVAAGLRHKRIVERIHANAGNHSVDSMDELQRDTYTLLAEATIAPLVQIGEENASRLDEHALTCLDALEGWKYSCPTGLEGTLPTSDYDNGTSVATESIGCTVFHALWLELRKAAVDDELREAEVYWGPDTLLHDALVRPETLSGEGSFWDDIATSGPESREDIVVASFNNAAARLVEKLGPRPDNWRWGRIHTLTLTSPISETGLQAFQNGPYANAGGAYTVNVAPPNADFSHEWGAAVRLVHKVESDQITSYFQLPGGQDLHRDSPYYDNLLESYLRHEGTRMRFGGEGFKEDSTIELRPTQTSETR